MHYKNEEKKKLEKRQNNYRNDFVDLHIYETIITIRRFNNNKYFIVFRLLLLCIWCACVCFDCSPVDNFGKVFFFFPFSQIDTKRRVHFQFCLRFFLDFWKMKNSVFLILIPLICVWIHNAHISHCILILFTSAIINRCRVSRFLSQHQIHRRLCAG